MDTPAPVRPWAALAVAVLGFAVSFALSWVPSLDFNEAATVVSALRPWPALWAEIHRVDAVHASYYALIHLWFDLVGYSPLALRIPASLAAGAAAGLLVPLGTRLGGRRVGIAAGAVFALLPQTTWTGSWGRQYALSMALATGLVLLFFCARDRTLRGERSWGWWAGFGLLAAAGQYVFGYLFLLGAGLCALLVAPLLRRATRSPLAWRALRRFGLAFGSAIAVWLPLASLEVRERGQVAWIRGLSAATVREVLGQQYFAGSSAVAVLGWSAALATVVVAVLALVRGQATPTRRLVAVAVPWLAVPTASLLVATALGHDLYSPRYLAFTTPAMALLMAAPVAWVRTRPRLWSAVAVAATLVAVAPGWAAQRTPGAREPDAWNQIAATIAAERAEEPHGARNAVVFGAAHAHRAATSQVIGDIYPSAFAGMDDVTLSTSYDDAHGLWDVSVPLPDALSRVRGAAYVWVLTTVESRQAPADVHLLAGLGYHVHEQWRFHGEQVLQLHRG